MNTEMMDYISLALGVIGTLVSVFAYFKAKSAKEAVDAVVERHAEQVNYDKLNVLLQKLNNAKDAAKRRRADAEQFLSAGYSIEMDRHLLYEAEDMLRTGLPLEFHDTVSFDLSASADQIARAIEDIKNCTDRDGWKDALSTLQTIIPRLEQIDREFRNKGLALTERA